MALPPKLKNFVLFGDGFSYQGQIAEVKLPKVAIQMEKWRGGDMIAEVEVDMGVDAGEPIEWKLGTIASRALREFGAARLDGVQLRFVGAFQDDTTGGWSQAELVVQGRHKEIDPGTAKAGEAHETTVQTNWVYLKWTVNGSVDLEIDLLNSVFVSGGVDRYAEMRAILGLA